MLKSFIVHVTDSFILSFKYCELVENKLRVSICVPILEFCSCVINLVLFMAKGKHILSIRLSMFIIIHLLPFAASY